MALNVPKKTVMCCTKWWHINLLPDNLSRNFQVGPTIDKTLGLPWCSIFG